MHRHIKEGGFSLVELLAVVVILATILPVASQIIISQLNINRRTAIFETLRKTWSQANSFIVNEAAFSERIYTSNSAVTINSSCGISSTEFRMAMSIRLDLPPAIYGVKTSPTRLNGDNVLWRCGPTINNDGSYSSSISVGIIADGLDASAAGGGLSTTSTGDKQVEITVGLKGNNTNLFRLTTRGVARINPSFLFPRESSLCVAANNVAEYIGTSSANTQTINIPGLACGGGGGDRLTAGTSGNFILEAGESGAATLNGNQGNDILRGTANNDTLSGGLGDDILIGRAGNDNLTGGGGGDQYSPGTGNDSITGGDGLDIIFLPGAQSTWTKSSTCNSTSCTFTSSSSGTKTTTKMNVVIYADSRQDL